MLRLRLTAVSAPRNAIGGCSSTTKVHRLLRENQERGMGCSISGWSGADG
ncbi:hypothetical protein NMD1_01788 [Novosphingobium sp. MD-1]|nr:hypothetical protein NMD1_01788 [Novosphingobium sp. MD-1]